MTKRPKLILFLLPFLAALLAFVPTLWAHLVWDDFIVYTSQLSYFKSLGSAFSPPPDIGAFTNVYYRPGILLSYLADNSLARAFGYDVSRAASPQPIPHLLTLLGHCAASGLAGLLAFRLFRGRAGAFAGALFAALVFALHPAHVESVALATGRSDVFATAFVFAAALGMFAFKDSRGFLWLGVTFSAGLAAMMFKEVSAAMVVLLPLAWIFADGFSPTGVKADKGRLAAVAGVLAAAVGVFFLLKWGYSTPAPKYSLLAFGEAGRRALGAFAFYVWKTFLPWPMHVYVQDVFIDTFASVALVLAFFGLVGAAFWRLHGERAVVVFCAGWFLVALSPSFLPALYKFSNAPMAGRYLYLPSFAFAVALGAVFAAVWSARRAFAWGGGAVLAGYVALVLFYLPVFKTDGDFWPVVTSQSCSRDFMVSWMGLGDFHWREGRPEEALRAYARAREPGMKGGFLYSRVANGSYADALAVVAEKALNYGNRGAALAQATEAVDILRGEPFKKFDEKKGVKSKARALYVLYKVRLAMGQDDRGLLDEARRAASEAVRRASDGEALGIYTSVMSFN